MNLNQARALSNLNMRLPLRKSLLVTKRAEDLTEYVFARAEETGSPFRSTSQAEWQQKWLGSSRFLLLEIPLKQVACVRAATDQSKVMGMRAAADGTLDPIIVDINKNKVGMTMTKFYPQVIVVDGVHRHMARRLQGREFIKAWVGELAAAAMGLLQAGNDHQFGTSELHSKIQEELNKQHPADPASPYSNRPYVSEVYPFENCVVYSHDGKKYRQHFKTSLKKRSVSLNGDPEEVTQKYVALQASAEVIQKRVLALQSSTIERAMQLHAMGSGPSGAPSSSLSQGSGPGPTMAMKPRPTTSGTTVTPTMKSRKAGRKRMSSEGGYLGYQDASKTQSQKTKGATGSDFAKSGLKGSGYFGYEDASDIERQRIKSPKGSEFNNPKDRPKKFNSLDDVSGLKGAADILADASKVSKMWTDCRKAMQGGWKPKMDAVAPPGWEDSVKKMKEHSGISDPYALAWYMKDKGYHPGGSKGKKSMMADVVLTHKKVDLGEKMPRRANPAASL